LAQVTLPAIVIEQEQAAVNVIVPPVILNSVVPVVATLVVNPPCAFQVPPVNVLAVVLDVVRPVTVMLPMLVILIVKPPLTVTAPAKKALLPLIVQDVPPLNVAVPVIVILPDIVKAQVVIVFDIAPAVIRKFPENVVAVAPFKVNVPVMVNALAKV